MNNTDNINKLITYLFIIGLALGLVFVYFAQERLYSKLTSGSISLGVEKYFRSLSVIFIFVAVLFSIFQSRKQYLPKFFIAYLIILGYITINYLITGPGIADVTGFMDTKGIGPWICLGLIFVGFDDKRYEVFKKFLLVSVIVISAYVIYSLVVSGIGLYRGQSLAKYRVYATNLVWISPFVFLILKDNKKLRIIRIFAIVIGISTALITLTRSFLLIFLMVIIFDFIHTKKKTFYAIGGLIVGILFTYVLLNTEALSTSLELLQQRGTNDTRSNQLTAFLSQVNFYDLIVGTGFDSKWDFNGRPYPYLDNQWLLLLWWAGLIPAMMYFYLTAIIPFKLFIKKDQDYETRVESFVLVIWTLACAGVAIYSTMSVDFYFFIICVIQGRLLYKYSKRSEFR
ncbi:hypothetical protein [Psychroserpens sp. MEBiC05023]